MSNEQWKSGGDCSKCRRKKYCKKECSEHKRLVNRVIRQSAAKIITNVFMKGGVL